MRYLCPVCGYVYDQSEEDKAWSTLPAHWVCPICGASKSKFQAFDETPATLSASLEAARMLGSTLKKYPFIGCWSLSHT